MKLTKLIFDYWKHWMRVPVETNVFGSYNEGLGFYDWYCMTFWYALNYNFYKMNNKKYAYTGCKEEFVEVRNNDVTKFSQDIISEENLFIINNTCIRKNVLLDLFSGRKNVDCVHQSLVG